MTTGDDESTFADVLNGLTFGGRRGRRPRSEHADGSVGGGVGGGVGGDTDKDAGTRPRPGAATGGSSWSMPTAGAGGDPDPTWLADRLGWMARNPSAAVGAREPGDRVDHPDAADHDPTGHVPTGHVPAGHGEPADGDERSDRWAAFGGGWAAGGDGGPGDRPEDLDDYELLTVAAIVRPYAWTRGRTRSSLDLQVETLVSAIGVPGVGGPLEHRAIAELCQTPHSVAEVAAALLVPLGIAKVLVSDMAETGQLTVHRPAGDGTQAHYVLMERVLSGLRRL